MGRVFQWGRFSGARSLFTLGLPWSVARWRWCSFWRVGRCILACWSRLGLAGFKMASVESKRGGAGSVELGRDGCVDEGE